MTFFFLFSFSSQPASQLPVWLDILQEASSLCRVFLGGEQGLDHKKQQKVSSLHNACENLVHSTKATVPKARDDASNGSTSKPEVCQL